jgi:hypothetical protein
MEAWILIAMFVLSFGLLGWGFARRSWVTALVGSLVLMVAGGMLFLEGYDSYVTCPTPGDNIHCIETTSLTYDMNQNISTITPQVIKVNGSVSGFSYSVGLGAFFLAVMIAIIATYGKISG